MNKITDIKAEEVADSRGNPTIKVDVYVGEHVGSFSVPSGASTGTYEACELRDTEGSKGHVLKAINNVEQIIKPALVGIDVLDTRDLDEKMLALDGTEQKTNLGANAILGVSVASVKVAALTRRMQTFEQLRSLAKISPSRPVPHLYCNLINGGLHAKSRLAFQEYMVVPSALSASSALSSVLAIESELGKIISEKFGEVPRGDEGGYALDILDVEEPLHLLTEATRRTGLSDKVRFAMDVAASSFYDKKSGMYNVGGEQIGKAGLIELYKSFAERYPIISIEDPFEEEDFEGFGELTRLLSGVKIVGDDLTVTNTTRLAKAIEHKSIGALIIKPNQIGTVTETLATMALARAHDIDCIVSHRSGETGDDFIADLAFAFDCFGLKAGSPVQSERMVKYKRLIKISE